MIHTNQQLRSLLQAILDDPADDDRRLIYADALVDVGDAERAELIRVQVELFKTSEMIQIGEGTVAAGKPFFHMENPAWRKLKDREDSLLFRMAAAGWDDSLPPNSELIWRRGFIAEVRCSSVVWIHYGPQLVREHPVELVVDSEANWPVGFEFGPVNLNPRSVAIELREFLSLGNVAEHSGRRMYRDRQEAIDDYSLACLKFAKARSPI